MTNITKEHKKHFGRFRRKIRELKTRNQKYLKLLDDEVISKDNCKEITEYNLPKIEELQQKIIITKLSLTNKNKEHKIIKFFKELEKILEFNNLVEELPHWLIVSGNVVEN